ncbi:MAG: fused MFS/spermidine synthase, partial [Proteobacteria bacterium]|nr:fused MFS/spermidine synthase [Pseudomonadota bacterium]
LGILISSIKSSGSQLLADSAETASVGAEVNNAPRGLERIHFLVLAALFVSGFSALVLEVAWSRYFNLIFGTSIYAFAIVLAAFLLGLSIGSFVIHRFLDRIKRPILVFAYIELLIAGFSLVVMQTSPWLEAMYFRLFFELENFYLFQGVLFFAALLLMIVPTSLMGANFPLAIKIFARSKETRGKDTGFIFSINTAGGIFGAFAAGFIILPLLGMELTGMLASGIYLLVGLTFLVIAVRRVSFHYVIAIIMAVVFILFGYKNYGEPELGIAVYYHGIKQSSYKSFKLSKRVNKVVYSKQGFYGLVTVDVDSVYGDMHLRNNGKVDASNGLIDMQTQFMLGYMPLFFHKAPEKVLNIGLGGGFSLGAITSHPGVKAIDTIEIDPLVVEATERYFATYNHNSLADERVTVHVEDGRHFIDTTLNTYDVIVSEPPNIWVSGVSQLFTQEFYAIADKHMNEGAILCQWIPSYEFYKDDIEIILSTIKGQFDYVNYWTSGEDFIVLASHKPFVADRANLEMLVSVPQIERDLRGYIRRTSGDGGVLADKLAKMISRPAFSSGPGDRVGSGDIIENTDDLPYLEFKTAQNIFLKADQRRRIMRLNGKGR